MQVMPENIKKKIMTTYVFGTHNNVMLDLYFLKRIFYTEYIFLTSLKSK